MVHERGEPATSYPSSLLDVSAPARWTRRSGSVSGTRFAGADSRWPDPFPPFPPPAGYPALFGDFSGTTGLSDSNVRSPSAYVLGLPAASRNDSSSDEHGISRFPRKVLRVNGVSDRARLHCARDISTPGVVFRFLLQRRHPGAFVVGGSIPGPHVPCPRFVTTLARGNAGLGPLWVGNPSTYDSLIHYALPV